MLYMQAKTQEGLSLYNSGCGFNSADEVCSAMRHVRCVNLETSEPSEIICFDGNLNIGSLELA